MPKDADRRDLTRDEIEKKKFETFFTTSVAQVPEEMINPTRQPDRKHGLLARFFGKLEKARGAPPPEDQEEEEIFWAQTPIAPTGEIMLDRPGQEKADGSLELAARPSLEDLTRELEGDGTEPAAQPPAAPPQPEPPAPAPEPAAPEAIVLEPAAPAAPEPAEPEPIRLEEPEPDRPAGPVPPAPAPRPAPPPAPSKEPALPPETPPAPPREPAPQPEMAAAPQKKAAPPPRPKPAAHTGRKPRKKQTRVPDAEDKELEKLKVMLETMGPQPARPEPRPQPEEDKEITQQVGGFHFFGVGEDEAPRGATPPPSLEDTMSIELHEEDGPKAPSAAPAAEETGGEHAAPAHAAARRRSKKARSRPAPAPEPEAAPAPQPEPAAPAAEAPAADSKTEPDLPVQEAPPTEEEAARALGQTVASLNLRCALSGILAAALLWAGLIYEGILPGMVGLSPATAPAAFLGANLLLLAAALAVSYSILRDGLLGLVRTPSYETLPALAGAAALIQAVVALLNPEAYQATTLTLMSGAAALALFMANLGNRLLAASVRDGYKLAVSGVEHQGAYRAQDKDLIRCLAPTLEEKDPWILLSRPLEGDGGFLAQSFGPRAGEKRAQLLARILLGCALAGALWMAAIGKGANGAAAALAAVLCLGAPLSSTLIAGLTALRTERTAGAVGAVIPGWAGIEELNGIDTVQVDAGELFTPESAQLEDIRIFKGGRIDRAILYTGSVLNQGCNTLSRLFRTIIADRTDILPPVKDLEVHTGLGFSAWCDNNRILIGTRAYMEQEGVPLPEAAYEAKHSRNGELQILYLAVSGNMYAMFVLRYVGGKHAARCLSILQKENIRLLVTCQDPSLTAEKIAAAYHLPEGLVTVLNEAQCTALAPAVSAAGDTPCCMLHLRGFASLTGGLRAAQRAQAAESTGAAVQMVSAGFSALIGLLLSYSGSIGTLSLLVVLMYQAAWSALSIAAAAMKQHS